MSLRVAKRLRAFLTLLKPKQSELFSMLFDDQVGSDTASDIKIIVH
jgi:hypothetical protein